ncbi:MAG: tRNA glutamyl-Q(34) synthetase GluQRS [Methylophilales bacterium]|nr:tRNA glutamyl-Q(34) synthetase GluQRS [Methylophilales bacterium]
MVTGRFAPSPTGPLHFGSLVAATASYLETKTQRGQWLVRIEDLDPPREQIGAIADILQTLETFGFEWDGEVMWQSERHEAYEAALAQLKSHGLLYRCTCSRKEIADSAIEGIEGAVYPGTCRHAQHQSGAWRVVTSDDAIGFDDAIQGRQSQNLSHDLGDFVLKRADGLYAYQLAVVVDDAEQGITQIVRGADLLSSTPRQIYLQRLLKLSTPHYAHVPIAVNAQGEKLSKQTLAQPLNAKNPGPDLWQALDFLGQHPPARLRDESLETLWHWAKAHWVLAHVPVRQTYLPI